MDDLDEVECTKAKEKKERKNGRDAGCGVHFVLVSGA
jgi:hypothetical protein